MEDSFPKQFQTFFKQYIPQRATFTNLSTVMTETAQQLKDETKTLVCTMAKLCKINYTIISQPYEFCSLQSPLQKFVIPKLAQAMRLFRFPNHKNNFSGIIYILTTHPKLCAELLYYALNARDAFELDNLLYFEFVTLPAMYNYFLTNTDLKNGMELINALSTFSGDLSYHLLKDITFSIFLCTNPAEYFEACIHPTLTTLPHLGWNYSQNGNGIVRSSYWTQVYSIAEHLVERFIAQFPRLPSATRVLLQTIAANENMDTVDFVINMFCRYLRQFSLPSTAVIISDLCSVIETASISLDNFFIALLDVKPNEMELEGLSEGISANGRETIMTPRDFTLLYKVLDMVSGCVEDKEMHLLNSFGSNLEPPTTDADDIYILSRVWNEQPSLNAIPFKDTRLADEFVNLLSIVNVQLLQYSNKDELIAQIDTYGALFMTGQQRLRLHHQTCLDDLHGSIETVRYNNDLLHDVCRNLFSYLYFVQAQTKSQMKNFTARLNFYINAQFIPALIEHYPADFLFSFNDISVPMHAFDRLLISVTTRVAKLDILDENRQRIKHFFFLDFVDQIDRAFAFQSLPKLGKYPASFSAYISEHTNSVHALPPTWQSLLRRCAMLFQNIRPSNTISKNLGLCLEALHLAHGMDLDFITLAIALSGNHTIIGFAIFVESYLKNNALQRIIMNGHEQQFNQTFIQATRILQRYRTTSCINLSGIREKRRSNSLAVLYTNKA